MYDKVYAVMELFSFLQLIQRESIRVGQLLHRAGLTQYAKACQHIGQEVLFGEKSLIEGIQERAQEGDWAAVARAADEQVKSRPS
jgi:hypothetical protein